MTEEEAIKTLEVAKAEVEWNYPMNYAIAMEEAIEALKKQIDVDKAMKFIEDYAFIDIKEIYTNGTILVPLFRVKQAIIDKAYNGLFEG